MAISLDDPFGSDPFGGSFRRPGAANTLIPQDQVEQDLGGLSGMLGGGLQYIGDSLGKAFGGRAIRNVLGGVTGNTQFNPRELLSIIPFSDALHITDPTQEVSGKEALGFDKNDDSWGAFGAGLATDIFTDPGTYLNPFGLTKYGAAAAKAGLLPKAVAPITREAGGIRQLGTNLGNLFLNRPSNFESSTAAAMRGLPNVPIPLRAAGDTAAVAAKIPGATAADIVDKPLRAALNFRVPFTSAEANFGTGATAQNIANNLGSIGDWAAYSAPGRAIAPLFDNRLGNKAVGLAPTTEIAQREARQIAPRLEDAQRAIEGQFGANRHLAEAVGLTDNALTPTLNPEFQRVLENQIGPVPAALATPEAQHLAGNIRGVYDAAPAEAAAAGREGRIFQSDYGLDYTHRQATEAGADVLRSGGGGSAWKPKNPADIARNPALDLPGGESAVNALFKDPQAALGTGGDIGLGGQGLPKVGSTLPQAQNHILQRYFGWSDAKTTDFWKMRAEVGQGTLTAADPRWPALQLMEKEWAKAQELPAMVAGGVEGPFKAGLKTATSPNQLWNDLISNRPKIFADSPVGLSKSYQMNEAASNLGAKGFKNILTTGRRGYQEGGVSVAEILKNSPFDNDNMRNLVVDQFKKSGALKATETEKALRDVYLPAAVAQDLTQFGKPFQQTRETKPLWKAFDQATSLNKISQTTVFPFTVPTLMRNWLTEAWTNLRHGVGLEPWQAAAELRGGGAVERMTKLPQAAGMTAEEATKLYRDLAYQHGIDVPFGREATAELVGRAAHDTNMVGTLGPLSVPQKSLWDMVKESVTGFGGPGPLKDKLKVRGIGGATETTLPPVKSAQEMMHAVDQAGRHSAFFGGLQQGLEPAVAAERAKWMRMGSEDLTPWERTWATRMLPYYRWMRTSIPSTLQDIAAHPGGLNAQTIRLANSLRENEGFIPDYVGEGLALPLGGRTPEGTQRYLSRFGLPFEELNKLASTGAHPLQRTMQQLAGNLNPFLKNPIEFMTGTQLYSGRHIDDLYNRTGLDQLLGMTPLMTPARFGSRLLDYERKNPLATIAQLASPATVTDADMNRALIVEGRRMLESELSASPMIRQFSRPYVPNEFRGQLSPHDERVMELYNTLRAMARDQFAPQ